MRGFYLKAAQLVSTRDDFLWLSLRFSGSDLAADGKIIRGTLKTWKVKHCKILVVPYIWMLTPNGFPVVSLFHVDSEARSVSGMVPQAAG